MSGTVIVASKLPVAVFMWMPGGQNGIAIAGERDTKSPQLVGWGLTYGVDGAAFTAWLTANPLLAPFMTTVTQQQIDENSDPMNTHGYEIGLEPTPPVEPIETEPPVVVDVPYVSQTGATLNCTMGNWDNTPSSYAYQWQIDSINVGTNAATYAVQAADVGHAATCTVTASNAIGSTTAPPSNSVVIA